MAGHRILPTLLSALVLAIPGSGQETQDTQTPDPVTAESPDAVLTRQALQSLAQSIREKQTEEQAKAEELRDERDPGRKVELAQELRDIRTELADLRRSFASIVLGVDVAGLAAPGEQRFDLVSELETLLEPLVQELKDVTEEPRQISSLRSEIDVFEARAEAIERGLEQLRPRLESTTDPALKAVIEQTQQQWQTRLRSARNRVAGSKAQLEQRLASRTSLIESIGSFFREFFQNQGLSLLLAMLSSAGVFLCMRVLYRPIRRLLLRGRGGEAPLYARLIAAVYHLTTGLFAILAVLVVFWVVGDWVLLGLSLILLFGFLWAGRQALPKYVEQIRLLLNIGPLREGERVVVDGISYQVRAIGLFTHLVNKDLSNGTLRIPIQELIGRRSRPLKTSEPWFPCQGGDWVLLSDGTRGKVVVQSPEFVQVVALLGGARQTWQTADFLAAAPRNLSAGFRISVTFGIDYAHQAICTTEIPAKMKAKLEADLKTMVDAEHVVHVNVEFKEAGASSLDYAALVDLAGDVAQRYDALQRAVQRSLVDACNENGWVIPFTQITVHQAEVSSGV